MFCVFSAESEALLPIQRKSKIIKKKTIYKIFIKNIALFCIFLT